MASPNPSPNKTLPTREAVVKMSEERVIAANRALLKIRELDRVGALTEGSRRVNAILGRLQSVASIGSTVIGLNTSMERGPADPTDADFHAAAMGLWGLIPARYRDTPELPDTASVAAYLAAEQPRRRRAQNP